MPSVPFVSTPKPHLIYIASSGFTGSTLLSLVLGAHHSILNLGEFFVLPFDLKDPEALCGCGKKMTTCDFWRDVSKAIEQRQLDLPGLARFRKRHTGDQLLRWPELAQLYNLKRFDQQDIATYAKLNADVFAVMTRAARSSSEISPQPSHDHHPRSPLLFLDSSKSVYRALWLQRCDTLDVNTLHLVKDPRAFVYSTIKRIPDGRKRFFATIRMALRFNVENMILARLKKHATGTGYTLIRYEELASAPEETLKQLCKRLGIAFEQTMITGFRDRTNHAVAGNSMRFESRGIEFREEWRANLHWWEKAITVALTYVSGRRYGYYKRSQPWTQPDSGRNLTL